MTIRSAGMIALTLATALVWAAPCAAQGKGNTGGLKVQAAEFDPGRVCDAKPAWVRGIRALRGR